MPTIPNKARLFYGHMVHPVTRDRIKSEGTLAVHRPGRLCRRIGGSRAPAMGCRALNLPVVVDRLWDRERWKMPLCRSRPVPAFNAFGWGRMLRCQQESPLPSSRAMRVPQPEPAQPLTRFRGRFSSTNFIGMDGSVARNQQLEQQQQRRSAKERVTTVAPFRASPVWTCRDLYTTSDSVRQPAVAGAGGQLR